MKRCLLRYVIHPLVERYLFEAYLLALLSSDLPILPYTQPAADWHAKGRSCLTNLGKVPSFPDGQIAAITYVHGLILITRNQSDFANFENLLKKTGLRMNQLGRCKFRLDVQKSS